MLIRQCFGLHILGSYLLHPVALLMGFEVNCVVCPSFVSSPQTKRLMTMLRSKLLSIRRAAALMGRSKFRRWAKETPSGST